MMRYAGRFHYFIGAFVLSVFGTAFYAQPMYPESAQSPACSSEDAPDCFYVYVGDTDIAWDQLFSEMQMRVFLEENGYSDASFQFFQSQSSYVFVDSHSRSKFEEGDFRLVMTLERHAKVNWFLFSRENSTGQVETGAYMNDGLCIGFQPDCRIIRKGQLVDFHVSVGFEGVDDFIARLDGVDEFIDGEVFSETIIVHSSY